VSNDEARKDPFRIAPTAKVVAICVGAGPALFAFLFCVNFAIHLFFFDTRIDRPVGEYAVMLTAFQAFFFVWMFVGNLLAFACLALWLLLMSKIVRIHAFVAAIIFVPAMTFVNCRVYGQYGPGEFVDPPPTLVFGTELLWEFPLRGFLLIAILTAVSAGTCGWLLSRRRVLVRPDDVMGAGRA
jgi:hypothetical protein